MFLPNVSHVLTRFCRFRGQNLRMEEEFPSYEAVSLLKGMVRNEGTGSDGHIGGEESPKLAETVLKLKKEV